MGKKYVLDGYTTPAGVNDREGVSNVQRMLGVTADGVWGPKTQQAYDRYLQTRMDGISASDYPNNEKNARMRDISPAYNFGGSQYRNILGISDPYFSGGDSFVAYADYLNERAEGNKGSANDAPVVEVQVRKSLARGNNDWLSNEILTKGVSPSLTYIDPLQTVITDIGLSQPIKGVGRVVAGKAPIIRDYRTVSQGKKHVDLFRIDDAHINSSGEVLPPHINTKSRIYFTDNQKALARSLDHKPIPQSAYSAE
jgi:hypothetical protein